MFLIIALEDFILLYVSFALINCSIGAYKQFKGTIANSGYEFASYFSWFFLWFVLLPNQINDWFRGR